MFDFNLVDGAILILLVLACYWGIKKGFIGALYSFVSIFLSIVLVYLFKDSFIKLVAQSPVGEEIGNFVTQKYDGIGSQQCAQAIISAVSVMVLYFLIGAVLKLFGGILEALSRLPIINAVNIVAGGGIGIVVGVIWVFVLVNVCIYIPQLAESAQQSSLVQNFGLLIN